MRERGLLGLALVLGLILGLGTTVPAHAQDNKLFEQARLLALRGDWPGAVEGFNALLARSPEGPLADDAYFYLGSSYSEMGRDSEAARCYRELLAHFPDSPLRPEAALRLASLLEGRLEDDRAAEQIYRDIAPAEKAEPSVRRQAQIGVARMKEKKKDYPAAVQEYRKAESDAMAGTSPGPSATPSVRIEVREKMVSRRTFLEENAARSPQGLPLYIEAERLAGAGRPAEAEARLRALMFRYPDFPSMDRALVLLAKTLDQQGRCPEAYSVMEDAHQRYPDSKPVSQYMKERRTLMELDQIKVRPAR